MSGVIESRLYSRENTISSVFSRRYIVFFNIRITKFLNIRAIVPDH